MAVSKNTVIEDCWRLFYNRIKSQVLTTTITGNSVITVKTYDSNFSDLPFEDRTYYPVIVVNTPSVPTEYFTAGKEKVSGTLEIDVYTYQSESADKFSSQVIDTIETYKGTLATNGLHRIRMEGVDSDMVQRGSIKVHIRRIRFSFIFYYQKTNSF